MTGARQRILALRPLLASLVAAGQHLRRVVEAPAQGAVAGEQGAVEGEQEAVAGDMTAVADMTAAAGTTAAVADMAAEGDCWPSLPALEASIA